MDRQLRSPAGARSGFMSVGAALVVVVLAFALAACGSVGDSTSAASRPSASSIAAAQAAIAPLPGSLVTAAFETLNFNGSFTDADTGDKYTMTWSFGDGSNGTGSSPSHAYSLPGTYTVRFQVSDGEGGVGQATTTVQVQTTQQAIGSIEGYVQNSLSGLNAGEKVVVDGQLRVVPNSKVTIQNSAPAAQDTQGTQTVSAGSGQ